IAVVGQASSHRPQKMQREKLMRKNSGYQRPSSRSAFCSEIQPTGQATAQRLQATQRSSPSGSRVNTIRPRKRGGTISSAFTSGYIMVSRLRVAWLNTIHKLRTIDPTPARNLYILFSLPLPQDTCASH